MAILLPCAKCHRVKPEECFGAVANPARRDGNARYGRTRACYACTPGGRQVEAAVLRRVHRITYSQAGTLAQVMRILAGRGITWAT